MGTKCNVWSFTDHGFKRNSHKGLFWLLGILNADYVLAKIICISIKFLWYENGFMA